MKLKKQNLDNLIIELNKIRKINSDIQYKLRIITDQCFTLSKECCELSLQFIGLKQLLETEESAYQSIPSNVNPSREKTLKKPFDDCEMSVRLANCLENLGIKNLGEAAEKTSYEILKTKYMGRTTLRELRDILQYHGLNFKDEYNYQQYL